MRMLMVLTSHDARFCSGRQNGFWLEEFAGPYYAFLESGVAVSLASPQGGQPPLDAAHETPGDSTPATERFLGDRAAQAEFAGMLRLADVAPSSFSGAFYAGGHGPLWDLVEDRASQSLIAALLATGKPVAAVAHGPGVLRRVTDASGAPCLLGRRVTGLSSSEARAADLVDAVPFGVEAMLRECGGRYSKGPDWLPNVVVDGALVTGQNPASALPAARAVLAMLHPAVRGGREGARHAPRQTAPERRWSPQATRLVPPARGRPTAATPPTARFPTTG